MSQPQSVLMQMNPIAHASQSYSGMTVESIIAKCCFKRSHARSMSRMHALGTEFQPSLSHLFKAFRYRNLA